MDLDSKDLDPAHLADEQYKAFSRSNEKKFICNYLPDCKAAFSRQEHLQRHIRKHTGERPFSCGCGRTFTRLDNLRQHAQTVHSGTEMAKISDEQNAIAAATKMRPTPNSPPPRLDGGSDTDPYPRPVARPKAAAAARPVKLESPAADAVETAAEGVVEPVVLAVRPVSPPMISLRAQMSLRPDPPLPPGQHHHHQHQHQQQQHHHPYENMSFLQTPLDPSVNPSNFQNTTQSYTTTYPSMPSFSSNSANGGGYTSSSSSLMPQSDVESSVGSQPISSLAKRRAPKHDFVYTGGHMMHHHAPGTILMSSSTADYDYTRQTPDEGEQMSEYINNGLEPRQSREKSIGPSPSSAAAPTMTTVQDRMGESEEDAGMDSHGDVPGILLHFALQNPDIRE